VSRFKAIGHFVYEKGDRIGVTLDEAAVELTQKLNAYQMRVERLKAKVERLTKAGDELHAFLINYIVESRISSAYLNKLDDDWNAAKEGKQSK